MANVSPLPFEADIHALEDTLAKLEATADGLDHGDEVRQIRRELISLKKKRYANLSAWETVLVSRHPDRPQFLDYIRLIFEDFFELHGDRAFGDDRALRTGFARIDQHKIMLIGHQKGKTLRERQECFYGCAHPEGYRKAINRMKAAAKYGVPVVCLIDTPGAYPGIGAEERGQSSLIAQAIYEMSRIPTPIICMIIGEGGSGGALGIGVGDKIAMLEHAYYSVISPEGCAGILWKTANDDTKPKAAEALSLTSKHLEKLGIIDDIIREPVGGAHREPREMASTIKKYLLKQLGVLTQQPTEGLLQGRYDKFRQMGVYLESDTGMTTNESSPVA